MKILFTGGGTGGHIYPIIAIKEAFEEKNQEADFLYVGPNSFSSTIFSEKGIKTKFILAGKLRRYFSLFNLVDLFKIPIGFIQSLWHLFWFMPDVIFSKGGYGSIPAILASWLYRIPIIVHESDSIPGLANKISSHFAKKIIVSFQSTKQYFPNKKTIVIGNPIRKELTKGRREEGIKIFNLKIDIPTILIIGGSQGAKKINEIVLNTLPRLLKKCQIIHICGNKNLEKVREHARKILEKINPIEAEAYHICSFLTQKELKHAYAASDLIISRAGSGSIFEIAALGKPGILIPLSNSAANHQDKNAQVLAKTKGALVLREENLTINMFLSAIFNLLNDPEKIKEMGKQVKSFYNPQTNEEIAKQILNYIPKK